MLLRIHLRYCRRRLSFHRRHLGHLQRGPPGQVRGRAVQRVHRGHRADHQVGAGAGRRQGRAGRGGRGDGEVSTESEVEKTSTYNITKTCIYTMYLHDFNY